MPEPIPIGEPPPWEPPFEQAEFAPPMEQPVPEPKEPEPMPEPQPASKPPVPAPKAPEFPPTWRDFVAQWAKAKPFLARIVEDAHAVTYGPDKIHLAVDPTSMAGSKLLAPDKQQAFRADFKALFGFTGALEVMTLADYRKGAAGDDVLPETLLAVKTEEKRQKHADLVEKAKNHPLTTAALETFGGKIESIDIMDERS